MILEVGTLFGINHLGIISGNMINIIKLYWKLILIVIFTVLLIIGAILGTIRINKLFKEKEAIQIELVEAQYENTILIEEMRQKTFNNKIEKVDQKIKIKETKADEIKKEIESPTVDFNNDSIREHISTEYYRRFPKN